MIVDAERARRPARSRTVLIHAFGQGLNAQHQTMTNYSPRRPADGPGVGVRRGAVAPRRLRRPPTSTSPSSTTRSARSIPLSLEGYGFCERGEGADFTDDGNIEWPDGALPVNTSGGGMSEAYVHGFNLIAEAVRQVRGTSTAQVDGRRHRAWSPAARACPTSAPAAAERRVSEHWHERRSTALPAARDRPGDRRRSGRRRPRGELRMQACASCGRLRFPPRPMCPWCQSLDARVAAHVGAGHGVVVRGPPSRRCCPRSCRSRRSTSSSSQLDEDPTLRMVGNLRRVARRAHQRDRPRAPSRSANAVRVVFQRVADDVALPRWMPVE